MNPRRRDACPNLKFVPERKSEAYRYEQKPMQMGKSEAQRLIEAAQILRDAKQIASRAILKGLIKLPTRMIEL
jgi:hypothetical protein